MLLKYIITFTLSTLCFTFALSAANFSVQSGTVTVLTNPPEAGTLSGPRSDTILYAFDENQGVTIGGGSPINVNQVLPPTGTFTGPGGFTPGQIAIGEVVNSHFFYSRPENADLSEKIYMAEILFDNPILMVGFASSVANLNASESQLGLAGTTYSYAQLEFNGGACNTCDTVTVSADRKTLTLEFHTTTSHDTLRVITQGTPVPIPEPETYLVMGGMVAALVLLSRGKRAKLN